MVGLNRRWVQRLGWAFIALALLAGLLWLSPAGSAYLANDDFAACATRAEPLGTVGADGELNPEFLTAMTACAEYCESIVDPSWLETVGLFVQTRVSPSRDGPSCVWQPGFSGIIPLLPGDDMPEPAPPP